MVSISPQYLPPVIDKKKHKRKRLLLVVFFMIILALLLFFIFFFNKENKTSQDPIYSTYPICGFEPQEQQLQFEERDNLKSKVFNDYLFYGENLSIYQDSYNRLEQDGFVGQTIQLRNVCTGTIHSFLVSSTLDNNVPLQDVPVGFYEVVIQQNLDGYRLVSPNQLEESIVTITKEGKRHQVRLIANRSLFTDIYTQELLLHDHELFIEIKEIEVDNKIVDIVLDPAYNSQDFGPVNKGLETEDFVGAQETYRFARDVQSRLQAAGLVVELTRPNEELIINTYGDTGRVYKAMSSNAKMMIEFYFESVGDRNLKGTSIYGSQFVSMNLQEQIIKQFDVYDLPVFIGSRNQYGAFHNLLTGDLDSNNLIRESGGYALGAGEFSEISNRLNQFAIGNRHGVHTVSMNLLMSSQWEFLDTYEANYNQMVEATVNGILSYLRINK